MSQPVKYCDCGKGIQPYDFKSTSSGIPHELADKIDYVGYGWEVRENGKPEIEGLCYKKQFYFFYKNKPQ